MNAYLIENIEEIKNLKLKKNDILLCHNLVTYYKARRKKKYFFSLNQKEKKKFINDIILKWYVDNKGATRYNYKGYSLPKILNRSFIFSFLNDIKNYIYLKYWLKKYKYIYLSKYSCSSLLRVKPLFKNLFFIKNNKFLDKTVIPSTPERKFYFFQKKNFFKKLFYFFDKIKSYKNQKIFGFKDTKHNEAFRKNKNILILNNKNFLKGYYVNDKILIKNFLKNKIKFDKSLFINNILKKNFPNDYKNILYLFEKNFNNHLIENKTIIQKTINAFEDAIKVYNPTSIILNGTVDWFNSILIFLSKKYKLKTYLILEGFHIFKDEKDIPKLNKKLLIDYYIAYGSAHKEVLKSHKIPNERIFNVESIFLKKDIKKKINHYDACLMCYNPWLFNLNTTWDSQIFTELEVLKIFQKLGLKKILIKKKLSSQLKSTTENRSIEMYQFLFEIIYKEKLKLSITINNNIMNDLVELPRIIVGGISTAIYEANNITDYYIYEPKRNGYSQSEFKTITSFDKKYINKTPLALFKNIKKKNFTKLKPNSLEKEISFSKIFNTNAQ